MNVPWCYRCHVDRQGPVHSDFSVWLICISLSMSHSNNFCLSFSHFLQSPCRWRLCHPMEKSASENPSSFYVKVGQKYTETNLSHGALLIIQSCSMLNFWLTIQINQIDCTEFKLLAGRFFFYHLL